MYILYINKIINMYKYRERERENRFYTVVQLLLQLLLNLIQRLAGFLAQQSGNRRHSKSIHRKLTPKQLKQIQVNI